MNERLKKLIEQRNKALTDARALLDKADKETRNLTAEEEAQYNAFDAEYDRLTRAIDQEKTLEAREAVQHESFNGSNNPQNSRQPGAGAESRTANQTDSPEYRRAMLTYLVGGRPESELRFDGVGENRSILGVSLTGVGSTGAVLAPAQMERSLLDEITQQNVVRQIAEVRSSGSDVDIPYASTHTTAYLVAEGVDFTASTPAFAKKTMKAYKAGALAYITVEAMQDMFIDMDAWIRDDFGRAFADLEEDHFINGTGSANSQPSGILMTSTQGKAAANASAFTADEILELVYSVNSKHRKRGAFLVKDSTLLLFRKLKDGNGVYAWQPSLTAGQPDRLLGYPLYTSDEMPAATTGNKAVLFGDFKKFRILDRKGLYLQRLNEIAATSGQVAFLAYRRYDSLLLEADAIKHLKMA